MKRVAFLRGINVGGNKKVPMAELKSLCEKNKLQNVITLLNTGNVIFDGSISSFDFEKILKTHFGFDVPVIIIKHKKIAELVKSNPFQSVVITAKTRLCVTFCPNQCDSKIDFPYISSDKSFQIIGVRENMVFSVLDLNKKKTTDAMKVLEKKFGKNITTRNYNTVEKIAKA